MPHKWRYGAEALYYMAETRAHDTLLDPDPAHKLSHQQTCKHMEYPSILTNIYQYWPNITNTWQFLTKTHLFEKGHVAFKKTKRLRQACKAVDSRWDSLAITGIAIIIDLRLSELLPDIRDMRSEPESQRESIPDPI